MKRFRHLCAFAALCDCCSRAVVLPHGQPQELRKLWRRQVPGICDSLRGKLLRLPRFGRTRRTQQSRLQIPFISPSQTSRHPQSHRQRRTGNLDASFRGKRRRNVDGRTDRRDHQRNALALGRQGFWTQRPAFLRAKTAGDARQGELALRTYCASCHGPGGTGGPKGSAITNDSFLALVSDQGLRTIVIVGRPELGAPDWRGNFPGKPMTDQEITDVVAWLAVTRRSKPGQALFRFELHTALGVWRCRGTCNARRRLRFPPRAFHEDRSSLQRIGGHGRSQCRSCDFCFLRLRAAVQTPISPGCHSVASTSFLKARLAWLLSGIPT